MDVEKIIKEQEEKLGRPVTETERQALEGLSMILGALWSDGKAQEEVMR